MNGVNRLLIFVVVLFAFGGYDNISHSSFVQNVTQSKDEGNIFRTDDFTLQVPKSWEGCYTVEENDEEDILWVAFYEKSCHDELGEGWLFSIAAYKDDTYEEQPSYEVIDTWEDTTYVAIFPTDVQFYGASEEAQKKYMEMEQSTQEVIDTFEIVTAGLQKQLQAKSSVFKFN